MLALHNAMVRRASKSANAAVVGVALGLMTWQLMSCLCGHFDAYAFIGALPGALLAWGAQVRSQSLGVWPRLGFGFCTVVTTFLLLKVIVDVLWTSHEPLFVQPYWVERWIYWWEFRG